MIRKCLILILSLVSANVFYAQNKTNIDSLEVQLKSKITEIERVNTLIKLGDQYKYADTLKTSHYIFKAIEFGQKIGYHKGISNAYSTLGWAYINKRKYHKAKDLFSKALKFGKKATDKKAISNAYRGLGANAYYKNELNLALENYFESLKIEETLGDEKGVASLYNNIGDTYKFLKKYKLAEEYLIKAINIHKELGFKERIAHSHINLGDLYRNQSKYENAFNSYSIAKGIYEEFGNEKLLVRCYRSLGNIGRRQGNYKEALNYYFKSLHLAEKIGDQRNVGNNFNNLGIIFYEQKDYNNALIYYKRFLDISLKLKRKSRIPIAYNNIGLVFQNLELYDSAELYFNKSIALAKPANFNRALGWAYYGMFKTLNSKNKSELAKEYLLKSIKIREDIGKNGNLAQSYNSFGKSLQDEKKYKEAVKYYVKAAEICKEIGNPLNYKDALEGLSYCYEKLGHYQKSLENHKIFKTLSDSLINKENTKKLTQQTMQFEFDKEKDQIQAMNEKEMLLKQNELERQKYLTYAFITGFLIVIAFALVIYRNFKQKQRVNLLLEEKNFEITEQKEEITNQAEELRTSNEKLEQLSQFKESLTSMIVHDLKNPINAIIGLSRKPTSEQNKLNTINNSGRRMMNLVLNILDVQKFEEAKFNLIKSNIQLSELIEKTIEETSFLCREKNIDLKYDISKDYSLVIDFEIILRVMVNIISNAIKYSDFNGTVNLNLKKESEDILGITIKDEGRGIPKDQLPFIFDKFWQFKSKKSSGVRSVGLGLTFCKMAIEAHGGEIKADSEEGKWTEISFTMPYEKEGIRIKDLKDETTLKNYDNELIKLNAHHKSYLVEYVKELSTFQPYETTDILNVLYGIESTDLIILKWKDEVENSIVSGNVDRFEELIRIVS